MTKNQKDFFPEWTQRPKEVANSLEADESHLTQDLEQLYQAYSGANRESLWRVQERLNAHLERTWSEAGTQPEKEEKQQRKNDSLATPPLMLKGRRSQLLHTLHMIAAMMVVALLIGSMLLVLRSASRTNDQGANAGIHPNRPAPGIYMATQKDGTLTSTISKADIQTHKVLWSSTEPNSNASSLVVAGNTLYYSALDRKTYHNLIYALDTGKGRQLWKTDLGTALISQDRMGDLSFLGHPIYANGAVYVLAGTGKLIALDARNGKVRWTYESKTTAQVDKQLYDGGQLIASNESMYGVLHNRLFALNVGTGKEIWQPVQIAENQLFTNLQIEDNVLYVSSHRANADKTGKDQQSYVSTFNARQGTQIWRYHSATFITTMLVEANGNTYFTGSGPTFENGQLRDGSLYALNAQGTLRWHKDFHNYYPSGQAVDKGLFYLLDYTDASSNKQSVAIVAFHTENGQEAWRRQFDLNAIQPDSIQVESGILYASGNPRQIMAYDAKSGKDLWHVQYGIDVFDPRGNGEAMPPEFVVVP